MTRKITVPKGLRCDGAAMYRRILGDLDEGLTFDALDLDRLHRAARLEDRRAEVTTDLAKRGLWVTGPRGEDLPNAMILREAQLEKAITAITAKLTLTRPAPKSGTLSRAQRQRLRDVEARRV